MPTSKSKNNTIGITLGDPSGIGPEVTAKALKKISNPIVIIGNQKVFQRYCSRLPKNCSFIDVPHKALKIGQSTKEGAYASLQYLDTAIKLIKDKKIGSLVTAPICKEQVVKYLPKFQGHTEYLAQKCKAKHVGMMFVTDKLKTIIVTRHLALEKVSHALTPKKVLLAIELTHKALRTLYKIKTPHIAVCGLNPHAGENGLMGKEEITKIIPALKQARQKRIKVSGPFAADTLFAPTNAKHYDAIVAMYHDQGLIPVKTLYFDSIVNLTVGLPFVRTSPAHGTAFDIAGKNKANAGSMIEAIKLAAKLSR